jgi:predicted  nucleic acid-binding Zn-ribbon protein
MNQLRELQQELETTQLHLGEERMALEHEIAQYHNEMQCVLTTRTRESLRTTTDSHTSLG